jgi:hypothetical protein
MCCGEERTNIGVNRTASDGVREAGPEKQRASNSGTAAQRQRPAQRWGMRVRGPMTGRSRLPRY